MKHSPHHHNQEILILYKNGAYPHTYELYWEAREWMFTSHHSYKILSIGLYKLTASYIDYMDEQP